VPSNTPAIRLVVTFGWALLAATPARAHQSSIVYLDLAPAGRELRVTFQISNKDLPPMLGADSEVAVEKSQIDVPAVRDYLTKKVTVENAGFACEPGGAELSTLDRSEGFFAVVHITWACKRTVSDGKFRYDLFFDLDPRHQGFARVGESQHIFRATDRELVLSRPVTLWDHLSDYLLLGVEHIFTGYDHLAFLFGLLLVAGWTRLSDGLRYVIGVVTAFTVAHSITLVSAGLGWLRLPTTVVEPAIALSIAYVAVENLAVRQPRGRWLLTFAFGLVHGFGFASVLRDIGLPPRGLVLSLLSFNFGVELGQLVVVTLVAPLLWLLRTRQKQVRVGGSILLLALSTLWFFERVLDKSLLGGWLG
jgi:hydrogenase/urease accessory protein HupE